MANLNVMISNIIRDNEIENQIQYDEQRKHWIEKTAGMNEFDIMGKILTGEFESTPILWDIIQNKRFEPNPAIIAKIQSNLDDESIKRIKDYKIIKDVMPVILRDRNCTWKIYFSSFYGKLYLNWSVNEVLINMGVNNVDAFKIKTLFGTHKKSMSKRNGYKYSAEIDDWFISKSIHNIDVYIIKLKPIIIDDVITQFEIIVRKENCEMNRFELEKQFTDYTNHMWLPTDTLKALELYEKNCIFSRKLFNYSLTD